MLNDVIRRYKDFNPENGEFDLDRGVREYARLLGVNDGQLSQILNDIQRPGLRIVRALATTFPQSADEIAAALSAPSGTPEREAIPA